MGGKEEKVEEELQARECLFPTSPANHGTLDKSLTGVARLGENWELWVRLFFKGTNH